MFKKITVLLIIILLVSLSACHFEECCLSACKKNIERFTSVAYPDADADAEEITPTINAEFDSSALSEEEQFRRKRLKEEAENIQTRYDKVKEYEEEMIINRQKNQLENQKELQENEINLKQLDLKLQQQQSDTNAKQNQIYQQQLELLNTKKKFDPMLQNCTIAKSNCENSCNKKDSDCMIHCKYHYNMCNFVQP